MSISTPKPTLFIACILIEYVNSMSSCESISLMKRLMGFGCAWGTRGNLTHVAKHECILRCFVDKLCRAVNYDVQENVCMSTMPCGRGAAACTLSDPGRRTCRWMCSMGSHQWLELPTYGKEQSRDQWIRFAGCCTANTCRGTLPGRWNQDKTYAVSMQNNTRLSAETFEVLVVSKVCSLLLVYYDAASGKPMPSGAILARHLQDGTPLYVAAVKVKQ